MTRLPPRRPAQASRPTKQNPAAITTITVVAALVVLAVGWALFIQRTQVRTDPSTLCPTEGPSAVTAILIDATDTYSPIQRTAVMNSLTELVNHAQLYEQFAVFSIDANGAPLKPALVVCRPLKPDEVSELTGNKALAKKRFDDVFRHRVDELINAAIDRPASDRSPIMEAIQAVSVGYLQGAKVAAGNDQLPRRLVVVSDMLENGEGGSHYSGTPDFANFRKSPAYARLRSNLDSVRIGVLYLHREVGANVQGAAHAQFWSDWFQDQGANVEYVRAIEG